MEPRRLAAGQLGPLCIHALNRRSGRRPFRGRLSAGRVTDWRSAAGGMEAFAGQMDQPRATPPHPVRRRVYADRLIPRRCVRLAIAVKEGRFSNRPPAHLSRHLCAQPRAGLARQGTSKQPRNLVEEGRRGTRELAFERQKNAQWVKLNRRNLQCRPEAFPVQTAALQGWADAPSTSGRGGRCGLLAAGRTLVFSAPRTYRVPLGLSST